MAKRPRKPAKGKIKAAAPKRKARAIPKKTARPKTKARTAPKTASKARMVMLTLPQHITLDLPPVLHDRLKALSGLMDMPMEAVMRQALSEFADTWEDHHRTVAALAEGSDRMQLVVKE